MPSESLRGMGEGRLQDFVAQLPYPLIGLKNACFAEADAETALPWADWLAINAALATGAER